MVTRIITYLPPGYPITCLATTWFLEKPAESPVHQAANQFFQFLYLACPVTITGADGGALDCSTFLHLNNSLGFHSDMACSTAITGGELILFCLTCKCVCDRLGQTQVTAPWTQGQVGLCLNSWDL